MWHRLDDLQPASDEVICRGITAPSFIWCPLFWREYSGTSLKSLISSHPPPMAPRPDLPLKGICVWKAKHSSTGSSSTFMDSQPTKPENESKNLDIVGPGRSFRNFKFNTALILQAMETAFLLEGPATFL
ncbi:hypothetical protein AHAS_Ahas14G0040500 [Arachis hypogaea]|uniref:Uncharacterized protein n=1 Tax=Arachis hypogaea TaxID=3818 RepID=A0A444ZCA9_ARAHY|nr:hypothetical protein Ahy_B04g069329 [Arachis hypogaea]